MTQITRPIGANISDVRALRLINRSEIKRIAPLSLTAVNNLPLSLNAGFDIIEIWAAGAHIIYKCEMIPSDAGVSFRHTIQFDVQKNRTEVNQLLAKFTTNFWVAAIADGNLNYQLVGTIDFPLEATATYNSASNDYTITLQCESPTTAPYISGILAGALY